MLSHSMLERKAVATAADAADAAAAMKRNGMICKHMDENIKRKHTNNIDTTL